VNVDVGLAVPPSMCGFRDVGSTRVDRAQPSAGTWIDHLEVPGVQSLWALDQTLGRSFTPEPVSVLSYLAALTSRVRLGVAVVVGASRGPIAIAKQFATLDWLSDGRVDLGLGLGATRHYPAYGVDAAAAGGAGNVLDELITIVRRLWTEDTVDLDGRCWTLHEAGIAPRPLQRPHPPIWIGGGSDRSLQRAIDLRSGWIGAGRHTTGECLAIAARLREMLDEHGVDRSSVRVAKRVYIVVEPDRAVADRTISEWFDRFYRRPELGAAVTVSGGVDECAAQLAVLIEGGVDHLILHPLVDRLEQYDMITGALLPNLRS
jgi:alkanesulfonate monooxygenase SsuD/methylene tetrahydromethanopterin reductase-like flavin-dependent oxidoreductase (luciferase family)